MRSRLSLYVAMVAGALANVETFAHAAPQNANIEWWNLAYYDSDISCRLQQQGLPFFNVNEIPLPTYTRGGPREPIPTNGGSYLIHDAAFNSSLLRVGGNTFFFAFESASGDDSGNHIRSVVSLTGLTRTPTLLFDVTVSGTAFTGSTTYNAPLEQIDPELAKRLASLREVLAAHIARLQSLGPEADGAAMQAVRYQALLDGLSGLLDQGFDNIDLSELNEILANYTDIAPDLYRELEGVINAFRMDIEAVRAEVQRISDDFNRWAQHIPPVLDGLPVLSDEDFRPGDYGSLPRIDLPDVFDDGEFDSNYDPYDIYAESVIAELSPLVADGQISERRQFFTILAGWQRNVRAISASLRQRAVVTYAEWGAFLDSQSRVQRFVAAFVTETGWARDSGIPSDVRELIDIALRRDDVSRADRLKAALNAHERLGPGEQGAVLGFVFALREFSIAAKQARDAARRADLERYRTTLWEDTIALLETAADVGWEVALATTPLGDVIDICEAVTGREGCRVFSGRELTWTERAFAGVGLLIVGSSASVRHIAQRVDSVCGFVTLSGVDTLARSLRCGATRFFARLDAALDRVRKITPERADLDVDATIYHRDGAITYSRYDGLQVTYDKRGFPEFERHHMHPSAPKPQVWVEFFCDRGQEFRQANALNNFTQEPPNYTWHHTHKFKRSGNKVLILMQLVEDDVHDFALHSGGIGIGKQILGESACR